MNHKARDLPRSRTGLAGMPFVRSKIPALCVESEVDDAEQRLLSLFRILGLDERVVAHLGIPPPWLLPRRSAQRVRRRPIDSAAASTLTPARGSDDDDADDVLDIVIVVEHHPET